MSYEIYKAIHVIAILFLFMSLGGVSFYALNGGAKESSNHRKLASITHGVALFFVLLGGFGMMARLRYSFPYPNWVLVKIVIWIALGGVIALAWRKAEHAKKIWWAIPILGALAVYMAIFKPF